MSTHPTPLTPNSEGHEAANDGEAERRQSMLFALSKGLASHTPQRTTSPESQRQGLITLISLVAAALSGYYAFTMTGPLLVQATLSAIAGGWLFLVIHSVRSAAEARRM